MNELSVELEMYGRKIDGNGKKKGAWIERRFRGDLGCAIFWLFRKSPEKENVFFSWMREYLVAIKSGNIEMNLQNGIKLGDFIHSFGSNSTRSFA